jgi:hypothetical protein
LATERLRVVFSNAFVAPIRSGAAGIAVRDKDSPIGWISEAAHVRRTGDDDRSGRRDDDQRRVNLSASNARWRLTCFCRRTRLASPLTIHNGAMERST